MHPPYILERSASVYRVGEGGELAKTEEMLAPDTCVVLVSSNFLPICGDTKPVYLVYLVPSNDEPDTRADQFYLLSDELFGSPEKTKTAP